MNGAKTQAARIALAAALAAALGAALAAAGRAEEAGPTAEAPKSVVEAIGIERAARSEWSRLIQTMIQVAKNLEASDPESARTIAAAAGKAQEAFIGEDMAKVIQFLQEGLIVPADATQAGVIRKLKEVLEALRSGSLRLDERLERLAEWKKHLESLENVIRRQKDLEQRSRNVAFGKELAEALANLAQQTADLARQQRELMGETGKMAGADKAEDLAGRQDGLREKADGLAAAIAKTLGPTPGEKNSAGRAAEHMGKAADQIRALEKSGAVGRQQKAIAELEGQARQLADRAAAVQKAAENPQLGDQRQKQGALAKDTAALASDMKDAKPGGESAASGSSSSSPTPGQESVQQAVGHQQQATDQLGRQQPAPANKEQNEALRNLGEARQGLSDAVNKEKEGLQQAALARIESMLRQILTAQKQVSADTLAAYAKRKDADQYDRAEKVRLTDLAGGEGKLAEQTAGVIRLLEDEGTTAVFPTVLGDVRADMTKVQEMLAAFQAGPLTQGIQKEIEERLQEMIDALQKELARRQEEQNQGQGGGSGGGKQPLVPPIAELKLIRTLEANIHKRTVLLDETKRAGQAPAETIEVQHKVLGDRQNAVGKMARDLAEIIRRSQD